MASFSTSSINSLKKVSMMVSMGSEPSWNVVEHSGLFPFSFQFFTCLAAVFADEVDDFWVRRIKQRSSFIFILCIHVCTIGDKQFDNFFVTFSGSPMQRSSSSIMCCIYVRAILDK